MPVKESIVIWKNGKFVPWHDATTHVLSHALHYGTAVFEGIRVYNTPNGPMGFRMSDHLRRLQDSARIYHMHLPYSAEEMFEVCRELVRTNELTSAYVRPIAYYGYGSIGVTPEAETPLDTVIAAFEWGAYLGDDGQKEGIDVCVSSWNRVAPNTVPAVAKASGNYLSSYLVSREAKSRGFAEGIALGTDGRLSEGAGENVFLVHRGRILTPPASSSIIMGITRDTVVTLARELGYEIVEQPIPREMLYVVDEIFLTGTACEITPVRSVDGVPVKSGAPGPVTKRLSDAFFGLFDGRTPDQWGWLEPIARTGTDTTAAGMKEKRDGATLTA
jgi:branched-chain amino acid aminotransferase